MCTLANNMDINHIQYPILSIISEFLKYAALHLDRYYLFISQRGIPCRLIRMYHLFPLKLAPKNLLHVPANQTI